MYHFANFRNVLFATKRADPVQPSSPPYSPLTTYHSPLTRDEKVLLLIQDSIDELLLLLDVQQVDLSLAWPVLKTLAQSCQRWRLTSNITSSSVPASSCDDSGTKVEVDIDKAPSHVTDHVTPEAIEEFFLQYHREKQRQETLGDISDAELNTNEEHDVEEGEREDPYNQSKPLSPLSDTVVKVMQRCGHHMSGEPSQLRLVVMETLNHCLLALQHEEVSIGEERRRERERERERERRG